MIKSYPKTTTNKTKQSRKLKKAITLKCLELKANKVTQYFTLSHIKSIPYELSSKLYYSSPTRQPNKLLKPSYSKVSCIQLLNLQFLKYVEECHDDPWAKPNSHQILSIVYSTMSKQKNNVKQVSSRLITDTTLRTPSRGDIQERKRLLKYILCICFIQGNYVNTFTFIGQQDFQIKEKEVA